MISAQEEKCIARPEDKAGITTDKGMRYFQMECSEILRESSPVKRVSRNGMEFACYNGTMIGKIDAKALFGLNPALKGTTQKPGDGLDFHSILKGKIEDFQPLEKMVVEVLSKALESILQAGESKNGDLFLGPNSLPPLMQASSPPAQGVAKPTSMPVDAVTPVQASEILQPKQDFDSIIRQAGQKYGVDPSLVKAVVQAESSGNPRAVSSAGAQGLMQLMPKTAEELGVHDPFDPAQNIMGGTRYLRQLLDRYQGDRKLALAAYNWGMGNVEKRMNFMPWETRDYILKVENLYRNHPSV